VITFEDFGMALKEGPEILQIPMCL